MDQAKLEASNGIHLYGWMVTDLGLKGGDLFAFAVVHQFAQSRAGIYKGNTPYLSAWFGWTEKTARQHLKNLVEMGLIREYRGRENNIPFCRYELTEDFYLKHPVKITESPGKNYRQHPVKTSESTRKKLPGDYNIEEENNKTIQPPTPLEVAAYCRTRGFVDPEGFANFYCTYNDNRDWMNGRGKPIKNWKNNITTNWEGNHKNHRFESPEPDTTGLQSFDLNQFKR